MPASATHQLLKVYASAVGCMRRKKSCSRRNPIAEMTTNTPLNTSSTAITASTQTVTLLVGQSAVINLQLALSGVQESVTVTGEAPLLDVTQSTLGGNIDARQMQELPVQGRNWMDLVMLAPGSRGVGSIN